MPGANTQTVFAPHNICREEVPIPPASNGVSHFIVGQLWYVFCVLTCILSGSFQALCLLASYPEVGYLHNFLLVSVQADPCQGKEASPGTWTPTCELFEGSAWVLFISGVSAPRVEREGKGREGKTKERKGKEEKGRERKKEGMKEKEKNQKNAAHYLWVQKNAKNSFNSSSFQTRTAEQITSISGFLKFHK